MSATQLEARSTRALEPTRSELEVRKKWISGTILLFQDAFQQQRHQQADRFPEKAVL